MRLAVPTFKFSAAIAIGFVLLGCRAESTRAADEQSAAPPAQIAAPVPGTNEVVSAGMPGIEKLVAAPEQLSPGVKDIIELARGGVGDDLILAFIGNWPEPFSLTAEEILYLTDLGVSEKVIEAMVKHQGKGDASVEVVVQAEARDSSSGSAQGSAAQTEAGPNESNAPSVSITATPEFDAGIQTPAVSAVPPPLPPATVPAQYNYFYTALSPYGTWVEVADVGLCWRPTVAVINPGWRPYFDRGRWVYSNYGWYWQSDYSWGWAPFHYGRWSLDSRYGWVWAPDSVWGPAWVTWRYSDSYCGWAPLPPGAHFRSGFGFSYFSSRVGISFDFGLGYHHYSFVPARRFCDRTVWVHGIPSTHIVNVYKETTVINNIQINNNTIVNEGIDPEKIAAATRSEIRKVTVRDLPITSDTPLRPDRVERRGKELVVFRPALPPANATGTQRAAQDGTTAIPSRTTPSRLAGAAPDRTVRQLRSELPANPENRRSATQPVTTIPSRSLEIPGRGATAAVPTSRGIQQQVKRADENRSAVTRFERQPVRTPGPAAVSPSTGRAALGRTVPSAGNTHAVPHSRSSVQRQIVPSQPRSGPSITPRPGVSVPAANRNPAVEAALERRRSQISKMLENRSVPSARSTVPRHQSVPSNVIRSRSPEPVVRSRTPSYPAAADAFSRRAVPSRAISPAPAQVSPAPRRELPKPATTIHPEKRVFSPGAVYSRPHPSAVVPGPVTRRPNIQSIPQPAVAPRPSYTPAPPRSHASRPTITTVPSTRSYGASAPRMVSPSRVTPAPRAASPAPSGGGRGRGEIRK